MFECSEVAGMKRDKDSHDLTGSELPIPSSLPFAGRQQSLVQLRFNGLTIIVHITKQRFPVHGILSSLASLPMTTWGEYLFLSHHVIPVLPRRYPELRLQSRLRKNVLGTTTSRLSDQYVLSMFDVTYALGYMDVFALRRSENTVHRQEESFGKLNSRRFRGIYNRERFSLASFGSEQQNALFRFTVNVEIIVTDSCRPS
jgi:hypothetical protein